MKTIRESGLVRDVLGSAMDRRAFLRSAGAAVAGGALLLRGAPVVAQSGHGGNSVAQTEAGKLRGAFNGKAHVFKGIAYGASTAGENRFMPPRKPAPWSGVRDATKLGNQSPQLTGDFMAEELVSLDNSPYDEDCLYLNVWTPALRDGHKRPVMVWYHGGGFTGGSGGDVRYDGSNLAHRHDVVVVTVNERLNAFGFLYLGEIGGAQFADSGNAGLLDLVASLQWVRDNIREFGGDPGNVTIFGQSGGGGKVATLMAAPVAKGLFHRAICESGLSLKAVSPADASANTRRIMEHLGVTQAEELRHVSVDTLLAAMNEIASGPAGPGLRFGPVLDHRTLLRDPWDPDAPSESAQVPMLLGSVLTEGSFFLTTPRDPLSDRDLGERLQHGLGMGSGPMSADAAQQLIALYRRDYPGVPNTRLFQIMTGDNWMIPTVTAVAERKAALNAAPAYVYHWEWITPVEGGRLGAPHTIEIPFAFDNMDVPTVDLITGSGAQQNAMAERTSRVWTSFARTGNPNCAGIPHWTPYSASSRAVMVFDNEFRLVLDPHPDEREAMIHLHEQGHT
jgi:para-nitrobenzyl esterase